MKFDKQKFQKSGLKKKASSDVRPRKKPRTEDPSTFQPWTSPAPKDQEPISTVAVEKPAADLLPTPERQIASPPASKSPGEGAFTSPSSSLPQNIVDNPGLAEARMEKVIMPEDLARCQDLPASKLSESIAHDLAKVMLFTSELGARYMHSNFSRQREQEEKEAAVAQATRLRAELKEAVTLAKINEENRADSAKESMISQLREIHVTLEAEKALKEQSIALASQRERELEELQAQLEAERAKAVEAFKEGDEAQMWLSETFEGGFEDAKKEILKIYPDLDLSSITAFPEPAPEDGEGEEEEGDDQ